VAALHYLSEAQAAFPDDEALRQAGAMVAAPQSFPGLALTSLSKNEMGVAKTGGGHFGAPWARQAMLGCVAPGFSHSPLTWRGA
jgi:hypothetical protein